MELFCSNHGRTMPLTSMMNLSPWRLIIWLCRCEAIVVCVLEAWYFCLLSASVLDVLVAWQCLVSGVLVASSCFLLAYRCNS